MRILILGFANGLGLDRTERLSNPLVLPRIRPARDPWRHQALPRYSTTAMKRTAMAALLSLRALVDYQVVLYCSSN